MAPLLALMLGSAAGWAEHRLLEGRLQRIARHAAAAALVGGDAAARLELARTTALRELARAGVAPAFHLVVDEEAHRLILAIDCEAATPALVRRLVPLPPAQAVGLAVVKPGDR